MANFFTDYFGETLGPILGILIGLAIAGVLAWLAWTAVRRMSSGLFVSRTKGRAARLAVTDAAPVDSHRRLVLVRRDDVEHLIMIGGPADIVIERGIGAAPAQAQAAPPVKTAAAAARDAVQEAERGRPVRQAIAPEQPSAPSFTPPSVPAQPEASVPAPASPAAPQVQMQVQAAPPAAAVRPPVAPPVFPEASAPVVTAPPATQGQRAEPSFGGQDAASATSKASAELDRILAEIELSRAPTR